MKEITLKTDIAFIVREDQDNGQYYFECTNKNMDLTKLETKKVQLSTPSGKPETFDNAIDNSLIILFANKSFEYWLCDPQNMQQYIKKMGLDPELELTGDIRQDAFNIAQEYKVAFVIDTDKLRLSNQYIAEDSIGNGPHIYLKGPILTKFDS